MEEVCTWSNEINAKIEGVDAEIENLGRHLSESRQRLELAKKEGEEALLGEEGEKQLKFEKGKLEMKLKYEETSAELKIGPQCVHGVLCLVLFLLVRMMFSNISIWE